MAGLGTVPCRCTHCQTLAAVSVADILRNFSFFLVPEARDLITIGFISALQSILFFSIKLVDLFKLISEKRA